MSLRLAILISGRGSNMATIARECRDGKLDATVAVVISDAPMAAGLELAQGFGIETRVVPWRGVAARVEFEAAIGQAIDEASADLVVLAGFMRILSASLVERYAGRMLNIHPSLLPKYRGLHTHARVLEAADRDHGATVHFVTAELDGGPAVLQSRVPVLPDDSEATLSARVQSTEHIIYPRVVDWIATGRLRWQNRQLQLDGKRLDAPVVEDFTAPGQAASGQR
jgi:phosphoribosylglycinamide formyltransferase-1